MSVTIEESWAEVLKDEFDKEYFKTLTNFVRNEYSSGICYPPGQMIFNAFKSTPFKDVKVVIIGQDPYHGPNQAHGLCFSVNEGVPFPPSLSNIFKEIKADIDVETPMSGDLSHWAKQGVLLLNATLTVRAGQAGSHQNKGWEIFTDEVINKLNKEKEGIVFLLWGNYAQNKGKYIDPTRHCILKSKHPSPLSANKGGWFGQKHFSKTNDFLISKGKEPVNW